MAPDGLNGVLGARGVEPAMGPKEGADQVLVDPDQENHGSSHLELLIRSQACSSVCLRRAAGNCRASRAQSTTTSTAGSCEARSRKLSRTIRFSRFRSTARLAHRFEMASPRRGALHPPVRARIRKPLPPNRVGFAKTRRKAAASRRRSPGGKASAERPMEGAGWSAKSFRV